MTDHIYLLAEPCADAGAIPLSAHTSFQSAFQAASTRYEQRAKAAKAHYDQCTDAGERCGCKAILGTYEADQANSLNPTEWGEFTSAGREGWVFNNTSSAEMEIWKFEIIA